MPVSTEVYKGITVVSGVLTGPGGQLLMNAVKGLADRIGPSHTSTSAPSVNNDGVDTAGVGKYFEANSRWFHINGSTKEEYVCLSNSTGAAVWKPTTTGGGGSGVLAPGIDATYIYDGRISNDEFGYLDGVTSSIQSQINNRQPLNANLTSLAGLSTTANKMIYFTAPNNAATTDISGFMRTFVANPDPSTARSALGLSALAVAPPASYQAVSDKNQPSGYAGLDGNAEIIGPIVTRYDTLAALSSMAGSPGELAVVSGFYDVRFYDGAKTGGYSIGRGDVLELATDQLNTPKSKTFYIASSGVEVVNARIQAPPFTGVNVEIFAKSPSGVTIAWIPARSDNPDSFWIIDEDMNLIDISFAVYIQSPGGVKNAYAKLLSVPHPTTSGVYVWMVDRLTNFTIF